MIDDGPAVLPAVPCTTAVRRVLAATRDQSVSDDLLFLERWELSAMPGTAAALRAAQIRRANPELAAEVRAEIAQVRRH